MKVINFFGGPGIGKSTIAAEYFVWLKKKQLNVELVTEYAKDLVYEDRDNILQDQLYILAKQNRRLIRLIDKGIDYVITDSPIILSAIYYSIHGGNSQNLLNMVNEVYHSYDNINFLLRRNPDLVYNDVGRVQKTVEEAISLDWVIEDYLVSHHISFISMDVKNYQCELFDRHCLL